MAFNYTEAQQDAFDLIEEFGFEMPIVRFSSDYDPVEGLETNTIAEIQSATVVNLPASSGTIQAFDNRFKEDFKSGKIRFFYVSAKSLAFEPGPGDTFIYEDKVWDMAGTTPLNPAGIPVLYTMAGRISQKINIIELREAVANLEEVFPKDWLL